MAQSKSSDKTKVHRIKAEDKDQKLARSKNATTKEKVVPKKASPSKKINPKKKASKKQSPKVAHDINQPTKNPFRALSNYFKGAWYELKQVRWPTRSATWSLTVAVLIFTAVFVCLILLLDAGFTLLFKQILT